MRKMTVPLVFAATAALITVAVMSMASRPVSSYAQARPVTSYAEDRAAIEDLQARYLFALDFHDQGRRQVAVHEAEDLQRRA